MKIIKTIGRITLVLEKKCVGEDTFILLTGGEEHIGAVALGHYDKETDIANSSVISVAGHREEQIALEGARLISKETKKTTLFTAGIHLKNITLEEISEIEKACSAMIGECAKYIRDETKLNPKMA
ncbi:hypothetical protein MsAm2_12730 [Methanolapillus ohkumae]|uniref:Prenylated flavin chaperone LpdD-like domain-containing protein n=1 Tax=Methanolapillus ohkumae TaxID=3028298 RepID=A0AA96V7X7_9EURY|nr:hypothetical protein MsAm2_12730 [Methanosarcinaceae archaeon Am2]